MKILNFVLPILCFFTVVPYISSMDNLTTFQKNERLDAISTRNAIRNTRNEIGNSIDQMRQQQGMALKLSEEIEESLKSSKESLRIKVTPIV